MNMCEGHLANITCHNLTPHYTASLWDVLWQAVRVSKRRELFATADFSTKNYLALLEISSLRTNGIGNLYKLNLAPRRRRPWLGGPLSDDNRQYQTVSVSPHSCRKMSAETK